MVRQHRRSRASVPTPAGEARGRGRHQLLHRGSNSDRVARLQDELQWAGHLDEEDKLAKQGFFGGATEHAVAAFQAEAGLDATGVVSGDTRRALRARLAAQSLATALPPPIAKGDEGSEVRRLQAALVQLGYLDQEHADERRGDFSGRTRQAVARLQRDNGLDGTGEVDADTWRLLVSLVGRDVVGQDPDRGRVLTGDPVLKEGSEGPAVRELERFLRGWGADLAPDGTYDADTTAAVEAFQVANHLHPDGKVGVATAAALVSGRAAPLGAGGFDFAQDIQEMTFAQATQLAREHGSRLFKRADFTILALRTGNRAVKAFQDHFLVLHANGDMRVFAGSTRPDFSSPSGAYTPTMLLPGNYLLSPRHWERESTPFWKDAYMVKQLDGTQAVPAAVNQNKNGGYDDVYDDSEQRHPMMDEDIRLHRGTPYGTPGSAGCLTVRDFDAFVKYLGGCNTPFELCLVDIMDLVEGERGGRGRGRR